jgi:hypothetical protein
MMKQRKRATVMTIAGLVLVLVLALVLVTGRSAAASPIEAKAAFDLLKGLDGEWTGTAGSADGPPTTVRYHVTAGGSAVFETLFPGTEHEMVTAYHLNGDALVLTHDCSVGNQPRMRLDRQASSPAELRFVFDGGTNFDPAKDAHIHAGSIRLAGKDRIESE